MPLYAFLPGKDKSGSFLLRPRFLAISEFGPHSLIYHEGRAFRVIKAKLSSHARTDDSQELATQDVLICQECGAAHDGEVERCHACNSQLASSHPVKRTLRIDNVEAVPAERITSNDEERVRQGFDIQTVFSWPRKHGRADFIKAEFQVGSSSVLTLQYANSAEIRRINKGLKRRRNATVLGFLINSRNGLWSKTENEDSEAKRPPDANRLVRIVPVVQDRKNALLLRFVEPKSFEQKTLATVQHAILRGITRTFQLEEGEVMGEPLPDRDNRRAILVYEATEGGAGVLSRLIEDPKALSRVSRKALEVMHFKSESVQEAIDAGDSKSLVENDDTCVRGCYRCLLSYFNQPDHEAIDRSSSEVRQLLIDLARGQVESIARSMGANSEKSCPDIFTRHGIPTPDSVPLNLAAVSFPFVWRSHYIAARCGAIPKDAETVAHSKGWTLFELPEDLSDGLPRPLINALSE